MTGNVRVTVCKECAAKLGYTEFESFAENTCVVCGKSSFVVFDRDTLAKILAEFIEKRAVIMECPPKVSIVIAVKDRIPTTERCFYSWSRQVYPFQEYIIVDDGSLNQKAMQDLVARSNLPNMKFVQRESGRDRTPAKAWNEGYKHTTGDFVIFTGGDLILSAYNLIDLMYRQYHGIRRISVITRFLSKEQNILLAPMDWMNDPTVITKLPGFYEANKTITAAGIHTYLSGQSRTAWDWFGLFINEEHYMSSDSDVVQREAALKIGCDTLIGAEAYHQWHSAPMVTTDVPPVDYSTSEKARLR